MTSERANPLDADDADSPVRVPFSLFEGDWVNRTFARVNLGSDRIPDLVGRSAVLLFLTWGMLTIIVLVSGRGRTGPPGENFFLDFAAYLQFVLGLPLFVVAERVVAKRTSETAWLFVATGIVHHNDAERLDDLHRHFARLRQSALSDLVCLIVGIALAFVTIHPELYAEHSTWHTITLAKGSRVFSAPGLWEMWIALPVLNYWWLRWIWKIMLWCMYLFHISRFQLTLAASHPDHTGGLGFLSDAQTNFGLVLLAYGLSNIASTIGYRLIVEGTPPTQMAVWGPLSGFIIGAPLLFTVPLLLFTSQLRDTKRRALDSYRVRAMTEARLFEYQLEMATPTSTEALTGSNLAQYNQWRALYEHIESMRVVPFDLRSFSELVGYATGPFVPLLTLSENLDAPPIKWLLDRLSHK